MEYKISFSIIEVLLMSYFSPSRYNKRTENDNTDEIDSMRNKQDLGSNNQIRQDSNQSFPYANEPIISFLERLTRICAELEEENVRIHITTGKTAWYTHRRPESCFMCQHITNMWEIHGQFFDFVKFLQDELQLDPYSIVYHPQFQKWSFSKNYKPLPKKTKK